MAGPARRCQDLWSEPPLHRPGARPLGCAAADPRASPPLPPPPACRARRRALGDPAAPQRYHFQAAGGWRKMHDTVHKQFSPDHPFTRLVPDLSGPSRPASRPTRPSRPSSSRCAAALAPVATRRAAAHPTSAVVCHGAPHLPPLTTHHSPSSQAGWTPTTPSPPSREPPLMHHSPAVPTRRLGGARSARAASSTCRPACLPARAARTAARVCNHVQSAPLACLAQQAALADH